MGDTHLAKGIIRCGYQNLQQVERLVQAIKEAKTENGAASHAPVEGQRARRRDALEARGRMRYARSIARRLDTGRLTWNNLAVWQRDLWYGFRNGQLETELRAKNDAYSEVLPECHEALGKALEILSREEADI